MRKLLPVLLAILGLGGGVGAGLALRPDPAAETAAAETCAPSESHGEGVEAAAAPANGEGHEPPAEGEEPATEFVKLNNQFIVPVVEERVVGALVILSLSLEVKTGAAERVYAVEPKLRDSFLQVLFDHANAGGFDGNFTESGNMEILRNGLVEVARKLLGPEAEDVLIESIVRQDA